MNETIIEAKNVTKIQTKSNITLPNPNITTSSSTLSPPTNKTTTIPKNQSSVTVHHQVAQQILRIRSRITQNNDMFPQAPYRTDEQSQAQENTI